MEKLRAEYFERIRNAQGRPGINEEEYTKKFGLGFSAQDKLNALDHFDLTLVDSIRKLETAGVSAFNLSEFCKTGRLKNCVNLYFEVSRLSVIKSEDLRNKFTDELIISFSPHTISSSPKNSTGKQRSDHDIKNRFLLFQHLFFFL